MYFFSFQPPPLQPVHSLEDGHHEHHLKRQASILGDPSFKFHRTSHKVACQHAQTTADNNHNEAAEQKRRELLKIDILVYSTGGLIVRQFLKNYYWRQYQNIVDHVAMCAPANFGSPFARKVSYNPSLSSPLHNTHFPPLRVRVVLVECGLGTRMYIISLG